MSSLPDDMTFTITSASAKSIAGVFSRAFADLTGSSGTIGNYRTIYAYNAQLSVATFTGAKMKEVLTATEKTYSYIGFDFSTYGNSGIFVLTIT